MGRWTWDWSVSPPELELWIWVDGGGREREREGERWIETGNIVSYNECRKRKEDYTNFEWFYI